MRAFNEAVSGKDGSMRFFVHPKSAFGSLHATVDSRNSTSTKEILVKTRSINEVINQAGPIVHLLKMDCEGSEYEILESLSSDCAARIQQISMETHSVPGHHVDEIPRRLGNLGFKVNRNLAALTAVRV